MTARNNAAAGMLAAALGGAASKKRFRITYRDPATGETKTVASGEYQDTPGEVTSNGFRIGPISAREWAEDEAYSLADKGPYRIKEI